MNVAICDDNAIDRDIAVEMLRGCFSDLEINADIVSYDDGLVMLDDIRDGKWFDIIFLDIYLDDHLGIDIAHSLRGLNYDGKIVFLTSSMEFAITGYDVDAAGYILKPVDSSRLKEVVRRVSRDIAKDTYAIRRRAGMIRIPLDEILYVESSNSKCILHRADGSTYNIYKRLDEIEGELIDKRFLRCSQSYIVNLDAVMEVDKSFRLKNGDIVLIRQKSLKAVQKAYYDYISAGATGKVSGMGALKHQSDVGGSK